MRADFGIRACWYYACIIFWNRYPSSWNGHTHTLRVFDICFRHNAAMLKLTIFRFFKHCNTLPKMVANGEPFQKKFGNWNSIYCRFRYWAERGIFDRIEKHSNHKPLISKGFNHFLWTVPTSKFIPMARAHLNKRAAVHRQESRGLDDENPFCCSG